MIFLNSASSVPALVFYLPGVCTHTDAEGKQSSEYLKKKRKKHNEHSASIPMSHNNLLSFENMQIVLYFLPDQYIVSLVGYIS